jgi:two-component system sensor histidine kinase ComP
LLIYQSWTLYLIFRYPISGITLVANSSEQWFIHSVDSDKVAAQLQLSAGDRVTAVDGEKPRDYWAVARFHTVDQADTLTIMRDDAIHEVQLRNIASPDAYDILCLTAEAFSLSIAFFLYKRVRNSISAPCLSLVFLDIGLVFMSIGGSVRGDPAGKFFTGAFLRKCRLCRIFIRGLPQTYPDFASKHLVTFGGLFYVDGTCGVLPVSYPVYSMMGTSVLIVTVIGVTANFLALVSIQSRHRK